PFSPGGLADVVLRALGAEMSKNVGQPILVENRSGASTMIGAEACARSVPDGQTFCMFAVDTTSITPFTLKKPPIDPIRDFEPITNMFFLTVGLVVNPSLGANTLAEFVATAKAKPGAWNYGSTANNVRLFMDEFNRINGTDIRYIPFKGGADAVNALLGNHVQALYFGIGNLAGQLRSGKLKVIAVDGARRSPLAPDVPTLAEAGYRGVSLRAWFGFFSPAGTPRPIVARLHSEIVKVAATQAFIDKHLTPLGLEPVLDTPEEFARFLKSDVARGEQLVRQAGLTSD
ncbi:MAG: tripartite tricarboxylate transporter substrate binding protein, partial [Betaproteobacteria bacterium]|nr:tripartite tricarboxylate transporter substrate binding protein [Betaproteobacteria bacterium]